MVVPSYSLALDDKVVGTFFQVFTFNSTVTSLRLLKSTKVTNRLSKALSEKISLSSFCSLLKEQIQTLRETTSLSSLNVRSNFIGDEETNLLAQTLRVNTFLSSLNLCSASISVEGANSLAQALGVNTSLSSLDLDCNSIGDERANSFAQTLRVNTSLSSLDLSSNSIGVGVANSLAPVFKV